MIEKLTIIFVLLYLDVMKMKIIIKIKKILKIIDISIIIPVFNSKKFLPLCLNSVINQSYLNLEIICVDNGSKDDTLIILDKYQKYDHRLKIILEKKQGAGNARNVGIKNSKGKFIAFMDSDDLYPNKYTLEYLYKMAIKNKALICGGGLSFFNENNILFISK